ncbi:MAG: hypothetical protein HKN21_02235 [Candidatus Eisenbacteria bacterium]|uniref:ArsR family transcriptional regulator n=1 Tax=Eiseniibacteriota bacterium TaxID=2212470 RepID=A0A7Y2H1E8_UNCEI|nr:hypothetical protein [Candidatus Eisenbacteria bacterium]
MLKTSPNKLLGSRRRTETLILVALLEESYPSELARLLSAPLYSIQKVVDALDVEGVLATRRVGTERRVSLNPRYLAAKELRQLLLRLAKAEPSLEKIAASVRRRPRRKGKAV